jgi:hypothetical protein
MKTHSQKYDKTYYFSFLPGVSPWYLAQKVRAMGVRGLVALAVGAQRIK